ncbi:hypothetical protein HG530_006977 [Fusarium avenaceum]|nr:hypothetical protein HG530_006977 [Fusarium avenaceum]
MSDAEPRLVEITYWDVEVRHVLLTFVIVLLGGIDEQLSQVVKTSGYEPLGTVLSPLGGVDDGGMVKAILLQRLLIRSDTGPFHRSVLVLLGNLFGLFEHNASQLRPALPIVVGRRINKVAVELSPHVFPRPLEHFTKRRAQVSKRIELGARVDIICAKRRSAGADGKDTSSHIGSNSDTRGHSANTCEHACYDGEPGGGIGERCLGGRDQERLGNRSGRQSGLIHTGKYGHLNGILKTASVGDSPTRRVEVEGCVAVENIVLGDNTRNTVCALGPAILGCTVEVGPLLKPSANAVLAPEVGSIPFDNAARVSSPFCFRHDFVKVPNLCIATEFILVQQIGITIAVNISKLEVCSVQVLMVLDLSRSLSHAVFASEPSPGLTGRRHADIVCSSGACQISKVVGVVEWQSSKSLGAPFSARRVGDSLFFPVVLRTVPATEPDLESTCLQVGHANDIVFAIAVPIGQVQCSAWETSLDHLGRCPGIGLVEVVLAAGILVDKHVDLAVH